MSSVREYLTHVRELCAQNPHFEHVVERQICVALLPQIRGTAAELKDDVRELLFVCMCGLGAGAPPPPLPNDAPHWEQATERALAGLGWLDADLPRYPNAARAVARVLAVLSECGAYPRPK